MIKFKANNIVYECPTSWSEVKFGQWIELNKTTDESKLITILTGIPEDIINQISEKSIIKLSLAIGFVANPFDIKKYKTPEFFNYQNNKKIPYIEDIKEKTYGQKIYLQHILTDETKNEAERIVESVLIYSQPYIDCNEFDLNRLDDLKSCLNDVSFVSLYLLAIAYFNQLKEIAEVESRELNSEASYEQKAAGVDKLSRFGVMNTIKALANNDILNYEKVLKVEYNTVFTHLLISKVEAKYQENYREILKQKSRRK